MQPYQEMTSLDLKKEAKMTMQTREIRKPIDEEIDIILIGNVWTKFSYSSSSCNFCRDNNSRHKI